MHGSYTVSILHAFLSDSVSNIIGLAEYCIFRASITTRVRDVRSSQGVPAETDTLIIHHRQLIKVGRSRVRFFQRPVRDVFTSVVILKVLVETPAKICFSGCSLTSLRSMESKMWLQADVARCEQA